MISAPERPDVVLAATGSEVALALAAAESLAERGVVAEVISVMWREHLDAALRTGRKKLAGVPVGWRALARPRDRVIGIERFGESRPGPDVAAHLGLTAAAVAAAALDCLQSCKGDADGDPPCDA